MTPQGIQKRFFEPRYQNLPLFISRIPFGNLPSEVIK